MSENHRIGKAKLARFTATDFQLWWQVDLAFSSFYLKSSHQTKLISWHIFLWLNESIHVVTYVGTELGFDFQYYIWLELQLQLSPFANVRLIKQKAEFEP